MIESIEPAPRGGRVTARLLAHPASPWFIVGAALLLASPSLFTGLGADDFIHALMMRERTGISGFSDRPWDLFAFATGNPQTNHEMMDQGVFPWWADPHVVLAFFRPISSATHYLDHVLWPNRPAFMHLQSLLWFAFLLLVVGAIYRRFSSSRWVAGLALWLYALDDARATVVGWIANRNAMVALSLSLPALIAYDKWRRDGKRWAGWVGPLMFGVGLLAGEAALLAGVYLVSYALFIDTGSWRARGARLVPYAAVVLGWRALYVRLGYGSVGSGIYVDPARDPIAFAAAAVTRLPVLLLGQFALPWSDFWEIYPLVLPSARVVVMIVALIALGVLVALLLPMLTRNRVLRFWAFGCVLSAVVMCSTFPHDRLLTAVGIGGMALVAEFLAAAAEGTYPRNARWIVPAAAVLAVLHLIIGPLLMPYRARAMNDINGMLRRAYATLPNTEAITTKSVVLVNPPVDPFAAYFLVYREAEGEPRPRHLRWLATGVSELRIERVDSVTLRVRPSAGFLSSSTQLMLRDLSLQSRVGERVALTGTTFEVSEVGSDGRPLEVLVRFGVDLEDRSLEWYQWGEHGFVPFRLPEIGQTVRIPAVDMRETLFFRG